MTLLEPLAAARGLQIQCELVPTPCRCSAPHIEQIVVNLLGNAIRFSTDNAVIRLRTEVDADGTATLSVEDEGPGIEEEHLDRIFERFYRTDASRNRRLGGARAASSPCVFFRPDLLLGVLEIGSLRLKVPESQSSTPIRLLTQGELSFHWQSSSLLSMAPLLGLSSDCVFSVSRSIHCCRRGLFDPGGFGGASDQFLVGTSCEWRCDGLR